MSDLRCAMVLLTQSRVALESENERLEHRSVYRETSRLRRQTLYMDIDDLTSAN